MKKITLIGYLFFLLLNNRAISGPDLKFENFGYDTGFPDMFTVLDIVQDKQGFLWFASNKYVVKYNGYQMKTYNNNFTPDTSYSFKGYVRSLFVDRDNNLWLLTNEGLSLYIRDQDRFEDIPVIPDPVLSYPTHRIQEDKNGLLWSTTEENGLYSFNKSTREINFYRHKDGDTGTLSTDSLRSLVIYNGYFWISTYNKGIDKIEADKFRKVSNFSHSDKIPESIASDYTGMIYRENSGNFWVALDSGRFDEFNPLTEQFIHHQLDKTDRDIPSWWDRITFCKDRSETVWITSGLTRAGVFLFDKKTRQLTRIRNNPDNPQSLRECYTFTVAEDRTGLIWVGEFYTGFSKFVPAFQEFRYYKDLEKVGVNLILSDSNSNLWIGSTNGLYSYNKLSNQFDLYFNDTIKKLDLSNNSITSMTFGNSGILWIGTGNGLNAVDLDNSKVIKYFNKTGDTNCLQSNFIRYVFCDSYGNLWISYRMGLDRYELKTSTFTHYKEFDDHHFNIIYEDKRNVVWFGEPDKGLFYYDKISGTVKESQYNSLATRCLSINEDRIDRFWISSCYNGLTVFDRTSGTTKSYTKNNGLASNCIYSIQDDNNGKLWLGTMHSLTYFDPDNGTIRNFNKEDGIRETSFIPNSSYKDANGTIYLGFGHGMMSFHPDSIQRNPNIPNIVFTDFKLFNKSVEHGEGSHLEKDISVADIINLSYEDNSFSFEFAALDYWNPKRNQYSYMMEGFDNDWIYNSNVRTASYTNLDPGEYTFRVKGSNNDGVWNDEGISIKIKISPPWWQTWWSRGSMIALVFAALGYTRHRKLTKMRREMKQQEDFTKQLIDRQESERKRIAGELHDSLGQNLLIIKNKALLGKKDPLKRSEIIDDISNISSSSLQEVREISYNLHPYQLEQLGLTKAIDSIIDKASESGSLTIEKKLDNINNLFSPETEINLFRMIQEIINNVLKHSCASIVHFSVTKNPDEISIIIEDNGRGFVVAESKLRKGLGLMSLNERARISGAKVGINSQPGKGTSIYISIPVPKN